MFNNEELEAKLKKAVKICNDESDKMKKAVDIVVKPVTRKRTKTLPEQDSTSQKLGQ
jgi:hypothetical protein